jgi:hypothetical protein
MDKKAESLFFENPATDRSPPGDFGLLYLLRRDINQCMEHEILWPGAMAILAGTDLLGKFMAGEDEKAVGLRFRSFIMRYFDSATHDSCVIRCFTLLAFTPSLKPRNIAFSSCLTRATHSSTELVPQTSELIWLVCTTHLRLASRNIDKIC